MNCACRAAPWRTFVQGLAQVHNVQAVGRKCRFTAASTVSRLAPRLTTTSGRSFDTAGIQRQEASAPAAAEDDIPERNATAHNTSEQNSATTTDDMTAGKWSREAAASAKKPGQKKPRKQKDGAKTTRKTEQLSKPYISPSTSSTPPAAAPNRSRSPRASTGNYNPPPNPPTKPYQKEGWRAQKEALKQKFPDGWAPRKRLSPDALAGIRALNAQFPDVYTTQALAAKFEISPEAIRRMLRTNWAPSADEEQDRQERWFRRGKQVWERKAAIGVKPPSKWRREGIVRDVEWHERKGRAAKWEREWEESEKNEERARRAGRGWGRDGGVGMGGN
ncbi:hypothetical protein EsDP_00003884 [Epichloe bromicola]|uniref:Required for respiratory growth protein 9, mitochondrial n=1 Tax=Epichloe bromicola TaxID=79588 RepID=A0ABQ0CQ27_9HYPO